jgi:hypothetical protein
MAKNKKKRNRQKKKLAQKRKENRFSQTLQDQKAPVPSLPQNFLKKDLLKTFICALLIIAFEFMLYWWKK